MQPPLRRRASLPVLVAFGWLVLGGCADDAGPDLDAGADSTVPDTGVAAYDPEPPLPPAPASMLPCVAGWEPRELAGDVTVCEPPETSVDCTGVARARFGETGCRDVGRPCGTEEWPDVSDAGFEVFYVREGEIGGSGTRVAPFGTIQEAVTAATAGDVIAISAGTYGGPSINVFRDVELRGVCARDAVVTTRVVARRAEVTLDSLSVVGADQALLVDEAATLTVNGVAVLDATTIAVNVTDSARLVATDLLIRDVLPMSTGDFGWGMNVDFGGEAELRDVWIEGARGVALAALLEDTSVTIEDSVLRATAQDSVGTGRAITVGSGAVLRASRVVLEDNREFAAVVEGATASGRLILEDAVIRRTQPREDGELGGAIAVENGGILEVRRAHLSESHRTAIQIAGRSTTAALEDVIVTDTAVEPASGLFGRALLAGSGSDVTVQRLAALRSHHAAILAAGGGTLLRLEDVTIRGVTQVDLTDPAYFAGRGLSVGFGARAEVNRIDIRDAGDLGILVDDGELEGSDVSVSETRGQEMTGLLGHGMQSLRSRVTLTRARFEANRAAGVVVALAPGETRLTDLAIVGTRERACIETTCVGQGAGIGLAVLEDGYASLSRFTIIDGALVGLQLASRGSADASEGRVAGHPVGANVQTEGFDITRITQDVQYDNEQNLDASALPLPVVSED